MLPTLLGDFKAKYPDVAIHLKVSNSEGIVSMVENNTIDLGVVESAVGNKNLVVETCKRDQLVAIVPPGHALESAETVQLPRLLAYPFICREEGSGTREVIHEHMANAGLKSTDLHVAMELGSPEAIKGAGEVEQFVHRSLAEFLLLVNERERPFE